MAWGMWWEIELRKRAVETTEMAVVHFYFNHLQEGDESPLPELFDLLVR